MLNIPTIHQGIEDFLTESTPRVKAGTLAKYKRVLTQWESYLNREGEQILRAWKEGKPVSPLRSKENVQGLAFCDTHNLSDSHALIAHYLDASWTAEDACWGISLLTERATVFGRFIPWLAGKNWLSGNKQELLGTLTSFRDHVKLREKKKPPRLMGAFNDVLDSSSNLGPAAKEALLRLARDPRLAGLFEKGRSGEMTPQEVLAAFAKVAESAESLPLSQDPLLDLEDSRDFNFTGVDLDFSPSAVDAWRVLVDEAIAFRSQASWNWFYDTDIFGVQDPDTGTIGYCSIMGALGQHFALAVHLGDNGLAGYNYAATYASKSDPVEVLYHQTCLMASFEPAEYLQPPDLVLYQRLKLEFPTSDLNPIFREYRPYYYPWFLTLAGVKFLTVVLQQARHIAKRVKRNKDILTREQPSHILVRVSENVGGQLQWRDEYYPLPPLPRASSSRKPALPSFTNIPSNLDSILADRVTQLLNKSPAHRGIWNVGGVPHSEFVQDGSKRPFFPWVVVCADPETNLLLTHWTGSEDSVGTVFPAHLLTYMTNQRWIPSQIHVLSEGLFQVLRPLADALRINLSLKKHLAVLEEILQDFKNNFSG